MSLAIANLVRAACIWEIDARKVGNVFAGKEFERTTVNDFIRSASAIVPAFATRQPVGKAILHAIAATNATVGQNTNLGIVLAIAPLAACRLDRSISDEIAHVLNQLTVEDAKDVYRAIRIANPGGLGTASEQDVNDEPTVTLLDAMKLAADRDQIANLYATNYRDVLGFGLSTFAATFEAYGRVEPAIIDLQLRWLAREPDTLIARKNGMAEAEDVRRRAGEVIAMGGIETVEGRAAGRALDAYLRSDGNQLNPGTTADLIAAVLFAALRERIVSVNDPFPWQVEDWL